MRALVQGPLFIEGPAYLEGVPPEDGPLLAAVVAEMATAAYSRFIGQTWGAFVCAMDGRPLVCITNAEEGVMVVVDRRMIQHVEGGWVCGSCHHWRPYAGKAVFRGDWSTDCRDPIPAICPNCAERRAPSGHSDQVMDWPRPHEMDRDRTEQHDKGDMARIKGPYSLTPHPKRNRLAHENNADQRHPLDKEGV